MVVSSLLGPTVSQSINWLWLKVICFTYGVKLGVITSLTALISVFLLSTNPTVSPVVF